MSAAAASAAADGARPRLVVTAGDLPAYWWPSVHGTPDPDHEDRPGKSRRMKAGKLWKPKQTTVSEYAERIKAAEAAETPKKQRSAWTVTCNRGLRPSGLFAFDVDAPEDATVPLPPLSDVSGVVLDAASTSGLGRHVIIWAGPPPSPDSGELRPYAALHAEAAETSGLTRWAAAAGAEKLSDRKDPNGVLYLTSDTAACYDADPEPVPVSWHAETLSAHSGSESAERAADGSPRLAGGLPPAAAGGGVVSVPAYLAYCAERGWPVTERHTDGCGYVMTPCGACLARGGPLRGKAFVVRLDGEIRGCRDCGSPPDGKTWAEHDPVVAEYRSLLLRRCGLSRRSESSQTRSERAEPSRRADGDSDSPARCCAHAETLRAAWAAETGLLLADTAPDPVMLTAADAETLRADRPTVHDRHLDLHRAARASREQHAQQHAETAEHAAEHAAETAEHAAEHAAETAEHAAEHAAETAAEAVSQPVETPGYCSPAEYLAMSAEQRTAHQAAHAEAQRINQPYALARLEQAALAEAAAARGEQGTP